MEFMKMHGAGNDFILIDGYKYKFDDYRNLALKVCDRHFGVGADGLMVCSKSKVADIKMSYLNSDGSVGEMCGNGIRCFSKFVREIGHIKTKKFTVETLAGIKEIKIEMDGDKELISVGMGNPIFEPSNIPVDSGKKEILLEKKTFGENEIIFSAVKLGVPHGVVVVKDIEKFEVNKFGKLMEKDSFFPEGININFIEIINEKNIKIKTWERGAGRTLACGTGSCASVVIGNKLGKLTNVVKVNTEGGEIIVEILSDGSILMIGDANIICKGKYYL